jgi:hypothetical protein
MKLLLAGLLLLAAPCVHGEDAAPATAAAPAAVPEQVDEREATLRDLENRAAHLQKGRQGMRQALVDMAADPTVSAQVRHIGCQASVSTMRAPDFFRYAHGKVKFLEKPKNFAQLAPEQLERLTRLKALLAGLEAEPDFDCSAERLVQ